MSPASNVFISGAEPPRLKAFLEQLQACIATGKPSPPHFAYELPPKRVKRPADVPTDRLHSAVDGVSSPAIPSPARKKSKVTGTLCRVCMGMLMRVVEKLAGLSHLSFDQKRVVELALEGYNVFVTGRAGTGALASWWRHGSDSVLFFQASRFSCVSSSVCCRHSRHTSPRAQVPCVPPPVSLFAQRLTRMCVGVAACNIGGITLHSFAGIGTGDLPLPELLMKVYLMAYDRGQTHR